MNMAKLQHSLTCRVFAKSCSEPISLPSTKVKKKQQQKHNKKKQKNNNKNTPKKTKKNTLVNLLKNEAILKQCLHVVLGPF